MYFCFEIIYRQVEQEKFLMSSGSSLLFSLHQDVNLKGQSGQMDSSTLKLTKVLA